MYNNINYFGFIHKEDIRYRPLPDSSNGDLPKKNYILHVKPFLEISLFIYGFYIYYRT